MFLPLYETRLQISFVNEIESGFVNAISGSNSTPTHFSSQNKQKFFLKVLSVNTLQGLFNMEIGAVMDMLLKINGGVHEKFREISKCGGNSYCFMCIECIWGN